MCDHYQPIDKNSKRNCTNCHRWAGKKCRDEHILLAEHEKRYKSLEYMMKDNKGARIEG